MKSHFLLCILFLKKLYNGKEISLYTLQWNPTSVVHFFLRKNVITMESRFYCVTILSYNKIVISLYGKGKKNTLTTKTYRSEERERGNEWMKMEKKEKDKRNEERKGRSILGGVEEVFWYLLLGWYGLRSIVIPY